MEGIEFAHVHLRFELRHHSGSSSFSVCFNELSDYEIVMIDVNVLLFFPLFKSVSSFKKMFSAGMQLVLSPMMGWASLRLRAELSWLTEFLWLAQK